MSGKVKNEKKLKVKEYIFMNIRFYDKQDYTKFQELCEDNNLTVTRAINGLIKQAVKNNKLPYTEV